MDYMLLRDRIDTIIYRVQELGGEVQEVVIEEPATMDQINQSEFDLGVKLPESFIRVLTEFSGNFNLRWFLPEDIKNPEEFREIFCGTPNWNLNNLLQYEQERKGWIENVIPNPEDEYDVILPQLIGLFVMSENGDY